MSNSPQLPVDYIASETKLFNGIAYTLSIVKNLPSVHILIGEGKESIDDELRFTDVDANNHAELFSRGHARAQELIQSNDSRIAENYKKIDKSGIDDA